MKLFSTGHIIIFLCLSLFQPLNHANPGLSDVELKIKEQQKELNRLEKKVQEGQRRLSELNVQIRSTEQRISGAQSDVKAITARIAKTETEMRESAARLERIQREAVNAEAAYKKYEASFYERLGYYFRNRNLPFLQILLSASSIPDLQRRLRYYQDIISADTGHFHELRQKKHKLSEYRQKMAAENRLTAELSSSLITEKNSLLNRLQADRELAEQIRSEQLILTERAEKLEKSSQYLRDQIENLISAREQIRQDGQRQNTIPRRTQISRNSMRWPLDPGFSIQRNFGNIQDGRATVFNPGVDIETDEGNVYAAESGIIFYKGTPAGSSQTYGKVVMIAHGDFDGKFISLYGNLSTIVVALNQTVRKGDRIATVAPDRRREENKARLHFQVRVNGEPQNPVLWLEKRN
jgi:septal ring factor EnvC (AmiA/AmiB activator)